MITIRKYDKEYKKIIELNSVELFKKTRKLIKALEMPVDYNEEEVIYEINEIGDIQLELKSIIENIEGKLRKRHDE